MHGNGGLFRERLSSTSAFVLRKDERNIINGLGEIMKLALVRSTELFGLLEQHGRRLVQERFQVRLSRPQETLRSSTIMVLSSTIMYGFSCLLPVLDYIYFVLATFFWYAVNAQPVRARRIVN